jgi:PTH2 family peptidyl-tRNA hydrolase
MSDTIKQVIVIRKDLQMRKGKMVAQGAHASMKVILNLMEHETWLDEGKTSVDRYFNLLPDDPLHLWLEDKFTKITVSVNSEEELLNIKQQADDAGIRNALITDMGATEFHGIPTNTCIAIGPDYSSVIDPITKTLKLL